MSGVTPRKWQLRGERQHDANEEDDDDEEGVAACEAPVD